MEKRKLKGIKITPIIDSIKGFSFAIVNENGLVYKNGLGFSDLYTTKIYSAKTIQQITSISKNLIGISLIKTEELSYLSFKDPINIFLPLRITNPKYKNKEIFI
ncbi:serine hydrolase [uncultured Polaribacter sp.]|uniref:serine hydrolase n=1 Tax=uncultured Polaribacter sp. TaxID=174711 RepID=UPI0026245E5F|nr:serine hydrolase [uncultured Polaribacter sp.]